MAEVYLTIEPAQVSIRHRWRTQIMTTAGGAEPRAVTVAPGPDGRDQQAVVVAGPHGMGLERRAEPA